jgi:hypothetical protein
MFFPALCRQVNPTLSGIPFSAFSHPEEELREQSLRDQPDTHGSDPAQLAC